MKKRLKTLFLLPALIAGLGLMPADQVVAQYTFGPQVQSRPSASITYDPGTGTFQYTDAAHTSDDYAGLPLRGNAGSDITTANGWTGTLTINISATSLTSTAVEGPYVGMGLFIIVNGNVNNYVKIALEQINYQQNHSDNYVYGTLAVFEALVDGDDVQTTPSTNSLLSTDGESYLPMSGATNTSPATEPVNAVSGVLTLTFDPSTDTLTGNYNGAPVGSYSLAGWGSNPSLTLYPVGYSGEGINVPAGTDTANNFSVTGSGPPSGGLTLVPNGSGTIQHGTWPRNLVPGNNYTVKAVPKQNYAFSNWVVSGSQSFVSETASLTFTMTSGLVLQANFVPNPFPTFAGTYEGLCMNTNNVTLASSGSFKTTVANNGSFSANLVLAGQSHSFSGQFSAGGFASNLVAPSSAGLSVQLQLDMTGNNIVTGKVSNNVWSADISAYRTKLYSLAAAEKYTVAVSGNTGSSTEPGGDGFGSLTVNTEGSATFSGLLADNTSVSETAYVSQGGLWPFYASLYSGNGMIIGWLALTNETGSDLNGPLTWVKGQVNGAKYYAAGFSIQPQVVGSLYDNTSPILNLTDSLFYLAGGDLTDDLTNAITLAGNTATSSNTSLKLAFTPGTGKFQGTVKNPATGGSPEMLSFKGVVLQKQNVGVGFYLGADQSGVAGIGSNSITGGFGPPPPP